MVLDPRNWARRASGATLERFVELEPGPALEDSQAFDGRTLLHAHSVRKLRTDGGRGDTCTSCTGTLDGLALCGSFDKQRSTSGGSGAVGPWQTMNQAQRNAGKTCLKAKRLHETVRWHSEQRMDEGHVKDATKTQPDRGIRHGRVYMNPKKVQLTARTRAVILPHCQTINWDS